MEGNMMMRLERGVLSCLLAAWALACGEGDIDVNPPGMQGQGGTSSVPTVTFTADIHPILRAKCGTSGCHDTANLFMPGHGAADVNVAYEQATGTGSLGTPIYERILLRTSSTDPGFVMPPVYAVPPCEVGLGRPGCLTQDEFDLIQEWVDQGHKK
jgi:hypothetical protein